MSKRKAAAVTVAVWVVCMSLVVAISATTPERVVDDVPDSLANCVAEQAYTHPMDDKWKELKNAIALCDGNGGK